MFETKLLECLNKAAIKYYDHVKSSSRWCSWWCCSAPDASDPTSLAIKNTSLAIKNTSAELIAWLNEQDEICEAPVEEESQVSKRITDSGISKTIVEIESQSQISNRRTDSGESKTI